MVYHIVRMLDVVHVLPKDVCSIVTKNAGDDREFVRVVNIRTALDHQMLQPMKHKKA